ncbi:SIR2 family protein [Alkalicoccobacillus porphyridii]|uniref:SIR2 family protein n=1 Tax=Alkalicoccobacillus porphyridii TaxID=2597270 RepID=A0A553ZWL7_9BACI|nr:SIR2 family protein [Alkalicoccobacillus porphyridii]TSB45859.1 SIR2 family protein [Alkalicoccobacillus porphyridii]
MALGLPGIWKLTELVVDNLSTENREVVKIIVSELDDEKCEPHIEQILNKIRMIRQVTKDSENRSYVEVNGLVAKELDIEICKQIYMILSEEEKKAIESEENNSHYTERFFAWLNNNRQNFEKEIFTLNYDMVFERSLENLKLPYYDGFVGAYEPFFCPESIEKLDVMNSIPVSWIKIWKMHGSLGWYWKKGSSVTGGKVVRLGVQVNEELDELVIYPSKEKYESSRKQPFITYVDRLKNYLRDGEGIFVISGYSFGDEHINDVIFDGLRQNNRLHVIVLLFSNDDLNRIKEDVMNFMNISVLSPNYAIISGKHGEWKLDEEELEDGNGDITDFWDIDDNSLVIGDFLKAVNFITEHKEVE